MTYSNITKAILRNLQYTEEEKVGFPIKLKRKMKILTRVRLERYRGSINGKEGKSSLFIDNITL